MAYLVVGVHNAYKIWCPRGAVKEKPGKKENSSNSFRGGDFRQDKTAIFSNGCFRPRIFSPPIRSGTRCVVTDDPLRLFRIPGVRTGGGEGGPPPGKRFASSFPPGPGGEGSGLVVPPAAVREAPPVRGHIPRPRRTVNFFHRIFQQKHRISTRRGKNSS